VEGFAATNTLTKSFPSVLSLAKVVEAAAEFFATSTRVGSLPTFAFESSSRCKLLVGEGVAKSDEYVEEVGVADNEALGVGKAVKIGEGLAEIVCVALGDGLTVGKGSKLMVGVGVGLCKT
jgi:hypothetical protein